MAFFAECVLKKKQDELAFLQKYVNQLQLHDLTYLWGDWSKTLAPSQIVQDDPVTEIEKNNEKDHNLDDKTIDEA